MADEHRTTADSLKKLESLRSQPHSFGFFSAVRMLDCNFREQPRTGTSDRPKGEAFRIGQNPTLRFPPSTLAEFSQPSAGKKWRLATYFFGLFGPNGALPTHLTDFAQQRIAINHDETFARFVDVFHHRFASFFYRAWAASQPTVHMDRKESDRFADYVAALCGLGLPSLKNRDAMPDQAKLTFCGHLACSTRHAHGLGSILRSFFEVPVELQQFVSHWIRLPEDCLWKLGSSSHSNELGVSLTLGARVRDCQQRFRIVLGPLNYDHYCRLLPFGKSMRRLGSIVDQYVGQELSWDVQLVLQRQELPRFRLGRQGHLGWTAWLATRVPTADPAQLVVEPVSERKYRKSPAQRDDFASNCSRLPPEFIRV